MKKLIILFLLIPFIVLAVFFFSFSTYSEDDGCVVVLNSFKNGVVFGDLGFVEADNAEKCNKNNTLILNTLDGEGVLKLDAPLKAKMDGVSFFVSSIFPEKRAEDPVITHADQHSGRGEVSETEPQPSAGRQLPGRESDFVIYYLYNDPLCSSEEFDDALLAVQEKEVNMILSGKYSVPGSVVIRPQLKVFESVSKPEMGVLVFSVIRLNDGEKKVVVRSFNRRFM